MVTLGDGLQRGLAEGNDSQIMTGSQPGHDHGQMILLPIAKIRAKVIKALELSRAAAGELQITPAPLLDVGAHDKAATDGQPARLFVRRYAGGGGMTHGQHMFLAFAKDSLEKTAGVDALGELLWHHDLAAMWLLAGKKDFHHGQVFSHGF